jgi:polyhydroxybutyrate depolymerase
VKPAHFRLLSAILPALLLLACAPRDRAAAQQALIGSWQTSDELRLSPGCAATSGAGGKSVPEGVTVRGQERTYLARVPGTYAPDRPHDFVVAFHGRTNPNIQVREYFDLDEALPEAIILYPSALPDGSGFRWSDPGDLPDELRDFALFDALLVSFGNAYCLDLDRVFVVGHSLGASFANSVACSRGELVRAVASVAGGIEGAPCDGGAGALIVHHPEDDLVPISAGERARDAFVAANAAAGPPILASEPELAALGCLRYGSDSPDPVVWCVHDDALTYGGRYYPHNWPDAVPQAIARFFRDLPRGSTGTRADKR